MLSGGSFGRKAGREIKAATEEVIVANTPVPAATVTSEKVPDWRLRQEAVRREQERKDEEERKRKKEAIKKLIETKGAPGNTETEKHQTVQVEAKEPPELERRVRSSKEKNHNTHNTHNTHTHTHFLAKCCA